ncbi:MAG TPA: YbhN family protein [Kofleriaceae bacterium]|nr:YbhN family protein [Kofleriaceae bacterium]
MTAERRARLWSFVRTAVMVIAFGGMVVAVDRLIRSYSYDQLAAALTSLPATVIALAIGVLGVQYGLLIVREWLAVDYAGRRALGPGRTALAALVARSLSTLGVATITGAGLRLRVYSGWGLTSADVVKVTAYNELGYFVGLAAQVAVAFTLLPVPAMLATSLGGWLVRVIGLAAAAAVIAFVIWCARGPTTLKIRTLAIPVPSPVQVAGAVVLPVVDLFLGAAIVHLCLPSGLALGYLDVVVIALLATIAGSLTQIPAGLGVIEGMVLLFADAPDAAPAVVAGLLVRRIITNLLPVVVGALLLVIIEVRRRPSTPCPDWLAETTATVLATLAFIVGVIVMVLSSSPLGDRLGDAGQAIALAVGTGILFVSRGLVRRSRRAWRITVGLVLARALVGLVVPPPLLVVAILVLLGVLLALSRRVFTEHGVVDESPRWWIAFAMALAGTGWTAARFDGRDVTTHVIVSAGVMLGVAAVVVSALIVRIVQARRERRAAG